MKLKAEKRRRLLERQASTCACVEEERRESCSWLPAGRQQQRHLQRRGRLMEACCGMAEKPLGRRLEMKAGSLMRHGMKRRERGNSCGLVRGSLGS